MNRKIKLSNELKINKNNCRTPVLHNGFSIARFVKPLALLTTYHLPLTTIIVMSLMLSSLPHALAGAGKTTASYLKVDVGAKAVAMGGNQFGSENSSFAQFYNPAFLARLYQREIGFMHNEFYQEFRQEVFTYVQPNQVYGNFAGALDYFSYGQIQGYDAQNTPTGDVPASDFMIGGSWGKTWDFNLGSKQVEDFDSGATLKILRKTLADKSAIGFAIDMGFAYPVFTRKVEGLRLAGAIQNLGMGMQFDNDPDPLPRTMRLGMAYSFLGEAVNIAVDGVLPAGESLYPSIGAEYKLRKMFSFRFGYKGNSDLDKNLTYGVGFENPIFAIDYAFVPFGELGSTHRVSFNYRFGKNINKPRADQQLKEKVKEAKTLYAQGLMVDAYLTALQVQQVAPWFAENNKLISSIQREFKDMEDSDKKEKLRLEVESLFNKGEKFFEEGNLINARLEFEAVLGLQPDHKAAQGYLRQIAGQFQAFVESFYRNGMIAYAAENYERAKEEFEKVLVIKPDHTQAKEQLAKCLELLDRKNKEAEEAIKKESISKTYQAALDAYKDGKIEESIPLFAAVIELEPKNEDAHEYLSLARETLFKQSLDKGKEAANKGKWEEAVKSFRKALEYNSSSKDAKTMLVDVQRRWELQNKVISQNLYKEGLEAFLSGDRKKAKSIWQKAAELDPENEEAKRGLSRIGP